MMRMTRLRNVRIRYLKRLSRTPPKGANRIPGNRKSAVTAAGVAPSRRGIATGKAALVGGSTVDVTHRLSRMGRGGGG